MATETPLPEPETIPSDARYLSYVERRLAGVERRLAQTGRACSDEALHEMRVEIKVLRAALRPLFRLDSLGHLRNGWDPVRRLFQAAGPLRDAHVHRQLLAELADDTDFAMEEWHNVLMWRETRARFRYLAAVRTTRSSWLQDLESAVVSMVTLLPGPELAWSVQERLSVSLSLLADLRDEKDWGQVDLHRVRKLSKDARYTLGVMETISEAREAVWEALDIALHDVHRALGGWHDALVAQEELDRFLALEALSPLRHPEAYRAYQQHLSRRQELRQASFHEAWLTLLRVLEPGARATAV